MKSINRVEILGYAGQNGSIQETGGGLRVGRMSIATTRYWPLRDQPGQFGSETTWHNIVGFERQADKIAKVKKGDPVFVTGSIKVREYQDAEGIPRRSHDIALAPFDLLEVFERRQRPEQSEYPVDTAAVPQSVAEALPVPGATKQDDDLDDDEDLPW